MVRLSFHCMKPCALIFLLFSIFSSWPAQAQAVDPPPAPSRVPSIKETLSLNRIGSPVMAPDGSAVAYAFRSTDWEANTMDGEIWLARRGEQPFQLTRTENGGSSNASWSPDGRWIAFLADRGQGRQVFLISPRGGEARPLTQAKGGVQDFQWGPDAEFMVLRIGEAEPKQRVDERESFGRFHLPSRDPSPSHLWWLDVQGALGRDGAAEIDPGADVEDEDKENADAEETGESGADARAKEVKEAEQESEPSTPALSRRLTRGSWTADEFDISPDGKSVVFSHRPKDDVPAFEQADLSIVDLETAQIRPLVSLPGTDSSPRFSPDGKTIAFFTMNGELAYYKKSYIAAVPFAGGDVELLSANHDGAPNLVDWTSTGIYFTDWQRTSRLLFHLDPDSRQIRPLDHLPDNVWDVSFAADGSNFAAYAQTLDGLAEIWTCDRSAETACEPKTQLGGQIADWQLGQRRIVRWPSRDGLEIEGVLSLPDDFDSSRRYPLLVIIHGGPTAVSYPDSVPGYVYPVVQWLAKGAVILQPNYRGSDGYGESFRSANVNRLGIADAWDVLSGVDYLIEQGFADPERLGVMGWSQGGYISAYLATTSDRFQGISVGAGISNWTTYYTNTDIPPFTRHYLSATPWEDPEIYAETSPMTFIRDAKTPTLIQHGENDRRVPTPNAFELYRGLQDVGVKSELIIYEDLGHGISRPKERLAAALHNWRWFLHTVWGEPLDLDLDPEEGHSGGATE